MRARQLAIAFLLTSTNFDATAQTGPAPTVWKADFQNSQCTLMTGSAEDIGISFRMTPGQPEPEVLIFGTLKKLPNYRGNVTVELDPGGGKFGVQAMPITTKTARVLQFNDFPHEFALAFAQSRYLFITDGSSRTVVPTSGAHNAFEALQNCVNETLPKWGVDPKALASLKQPPTTIDGKFWISGNDYPLDAQRADWMGYVVVRLNVDATGDVTQCAVVVSSGWKSVDKVTCGNAVARARFHPAIGPDGKPTAAVRTSNVVFRMAG
jgi:TonB family protein